MSNPYETDKNLKEAVVGYVSGVWCRFKAMLKFHRFQEFLRRKIDESMSNYVRFLGEMSPEKKELLNYVMSRNTGRYDLVDEFPWGWVWLEEKVHRVFMQFGIDTDFLTDFNWSLRDFAYFVVELAGRIKKREDDEGKFSNDKEVIEYEVKALLIERYTHIDISIVPIIVEKFESIDVIYKVSISLSSVLNLSVVSSFDLNDKISFEDRSGVRCLVTEDMEEKTTRSRSAQ